MPPKPPIYTYRALLEEQQYPIIDFFVWKIVLSKTNLRPVHCGQCASQFTVGECVKHRQYSDNYFLCIPCAKELILKFGSKGFNLNILSNLRAVDISTPIYTAQQVADSITKYILTHHPENGLEILTLPIDDILG